MISILPEDVNQRILDQLIESDRSWAARTLPGVNKGVRKNYYASLTSIACRVASFTDRLAALRMIRETKKLRKVHITFVRENDDRRDAPYDFVIKKPVETFIITTGYRISKYPSHLKTLIIDVDCENPDDRSYIAEIPGTVEYASIHAGIFDGALDDWGWDERYMMFDTLFRRAKNVRVLDIKLKFIGDFTNFTSNMKHLQVLKLDLIESIFVSRDEDVDLRHCTDLKVFGLLSDEYCAKYNLILPPSLEVMHVGKHAFEFPDGIPRLKAMSITLWSETQYFDKDTWLALWEHVDVAVLYFGFDLHNQADHVIDHILPAGKKLALYIYMDYTESLTHLRALKTFANRATEIVVMTEDLFGSGECLRVIRETCPNAALFHTVQYEYDSFTPVSWDVLMGDGRMPEMPVEMKRRFISGAGLHMQRIK
jgi:hypothetical protein